MYLKRCFYFLFCILFCILPDNPVYSTEHSGELWLNNVVRIFVYKNITDCDNKDDTESADNSGFGFVVGEKGDYLYIVTADHVVNIGEDSLCIRVQFHGNANNCVFAGFISLEISFEVTLDLALLKVKKPYSDYRWKKKYYSCDYKKNDTVWFIGKDLKWEFPIRCGYITNINNTNHIITISRMEGVYEGCSGAPVFTRKGIIGMMITDSITGTVDTLRIDIIKNILVDNNVPWDMINYNTIPSPNKKERFNITLGGYGFTNSLNLEYFNAGGFVGSEMKLIDGQYIKHFIATEIGYIHWDEESSYQTLPGAQEQSLENYNPFGYLLLLWRIYIISDPSISFSLEAGTGGLLKFSENIDPSRIFQAGIAFNFYFKPFRFSINIRDFMPYIEIREIVFNIFSEAGIEESNEIFHLLHIGLSLSYTIEF